MRVRRVVASATSLVVVLGATSWLGASSVSAKTPAALSSYVCQGAQLTLFNNTNGNPVSNGGSPPTFSTNGQAYCVTYIQTYHWNDGHGDTPGHLSLTRLSGPKGLAKKTHYFSSVGSPGQNDVPNANHYADVPLSPPTIIDGTYQCDDTVRSSWSANSGSGGAGFCIVYADPAVPPGTPVGGTTTTTLAPVHKSTSSVLRDVTLGIVVVVVLGALWWYLFGRHDENEDAPRVKKESRPDPEPEQETDPVYLTEGTVGPTPYDHEGPAPPPASLENDFLVEPIPDTSPPGSAPGE